MANGVVLLCVILKKVVLVSPMPCLAGSKVPGSTSWAWVPSYIRALLLRAMAAMALAPPLQIWQTLGFVRKRYVNFVYIINSMVVVVSTD